MPNPCVGNEYELGRKGGSDNSKCEKPLHVSTTIANRRDREVNTGFRYAGALAWVISSALLPEVDVA